jgi:hypothetical protein
LDFMRVRSGNIDEFGMNHTTDEYREPAMKTPFIHQLHRRLGLAFCLFVLMASGSGIVHIIMSMTQSPPPQAGTATHRPILVLEAFKLSPLQAAHSLPPSLQAPIAVNLRLIEGAPWYAFHPLSGGKPTYVHAMTGLVDLEMDARFAQEIATRHLGTGDIRQTDYLTAFNREYISIFRILPVYRFDVDDGRGTRVYVSTVTEGVTRETNNRKQMEADIFSLFHKFMFIPEKTARGITLGLTTMGIFLTALAGVLLYLIPKRKFRP